jgi:hypothetical protein
LKDALNIVNPKQNGKQSQDTFSDGQPKHGAL